MITRTLDYTRADSVTLWTQRRLHTGEGAVSSDGTTETVVYHDDSGP